MLFIVRHGNTFEAGESPRRIGARTDLPLTQAGVEQGRALGAHFAAQGIRFDRVLVSPLLRARETAAAILESIGQGPAMASCDWLREIDHGPDEDQPEDAVVARIGRDALHAWDSRAEPPAGWTVDAPARLAAWQALLAEPLAGPVLLVTSNGAARFALLADPSLVEASGRLASLKLPTGGYGVIRRGAQGSWELSDWGRRP